MSYSLVINGRVKVWQELRGKIKNLKTYDARGVSRAGSVSQAVKNMRGQAKIKWFQEFQSQKDRYDGKIKTFVESYDFEKDTTRGVTRKRYVRNGKYYFYVKDNATGYFITSGRWSSKPLGDSIDEELDISDDYDPGLVTQR